MARTLMPAAPAPAPRSPAAGRPRTARAASGFAALALLAGALALGGCASTDALYAEYDEMMCRVEIASAPPAVAAAVDESVVLRELIEKSYFPWEPAVYFAFNSDALDAENVARLEGAVDVLARFENVYVSLQGFTDRIGSSSYNAWLASRRVNSVRDYLVERGADASRLVSQPLGEGLPTFGDDDAKARAVNRRVELMLLDLDGRPLHPLFDFDTTGARTPFARPLDGEGVLDGASAPGSARPPAAGLRLEDAPSGPAGAGGLPPGEPSR